MFLLDTNIISAMAPSKKADRHALATWLDQASNHLFLSVVTASEVAAGIAKAEREGVTTKANSLRGWWQAVQHLYGERVLPFDLRAAHAAGLILDRARAHRPGFEDIAIAATAEVHGLTILTDNERHFAPLGVPMLNPLKSLPSLPAQSS
ncbi:type II toxin-antitoxin system VapC family toxin [Mesorhizobium sp. M7A.F.Ca.US.011.01.1.1]|jgi:predicted nucleic acid-binding protein|uniref:type II toxin-antitoxin system VapC family toxin n=1 Tax=Mesorhizobium sp. M7A.F.Ca.US.011.01.1.1 TaxID=2496741 RepID=UPI000FCC18FD|nr:type II toxin-antitoxin system VapC family toxin [Mesorhizobium sp. M7A.F.Ca.US.011.01.1.1]RUX32719.1 type II toxin-antitoxin system VapC family toxin [Mesorhizobium sp. M7A.F.Ca.US.011.01.1.1]